MDKQEEKKPQETLEEKLARVEKSLQDKDNTIAELTAKNEELTKKVTSLKIDGLVRQVEPISQPVPEEVQFDFDL